MFRHKTIKINLLVVSIFVVCWHVSPKTSNSITTHQANHEFSVVPWEEANDSTDHSIHFTTLANLLPADSILNKEKIVLHKKAFLALKSNLLFDLATIVNLEVEVPIGQRWSVGVEGFFPWWVDKKNNDFALQILSGNVETKYWLANRIKHPQVLTGQYIGAYFGVGIYDFQFNKKGGTQGDFHMGGLAFGYAVPIFRNNFLLEFSVGLGYVLSNYCHYKINDNRTRLHWDYDASYNWIGPNQAKVSLVWFLGKTSKSHK